MYYAKPVSVLLHDPISFPLGLQSLMILYCVNALLLNPGTNNYLIVVGHVWV